MKKLIINPIVAKYLVFNGLFSFAISFSFAIYTPFLLSKGMNLFQVNLINASFMIVNFLAEMPTGGFADRFGRHNSLIVSCLLVIISSITYYFSGSLLTFILAESIGAIGHTFASGATDAWLVDSLKIRNEYHLKEKIFRKEMFINNFGVIVGCTMGSFLGGIELGLAWIGSAMAMFLTGLFTLFFIKENYAHQMQRDCSGSILQNIKGAWSLGINEKKLLYIMSFGTLVTLSFQGINMQWSVLFQTDYHFTSLQLGFLFAAIAVFIVSGGMLSAYIHKIIKNRILAMIIPQLITAIIIITCSRLTNLYLVTSTFLLHEVTRGMLKPLRKSYINDYFVSDKRATLSSLDSMFDKAGATIGLVVSGLLANSLSIRLTWLFSGLFLIIGVIFFIWRQPKTATN
ncbi:MAG: MFS transporter [Patescibacteria group bacterium]